MSIIRRKPQHNYEELEEIVITIPNMLEHVQISKARRAKYYNTKTDKIPKKYYDTKHFQWKDNTIYDKTDKSKVIKNNQTAGTPRFWKVSGNSIYDGTLHPQVRRIISDKVHLYFADYIRDLPKLNKNLKKNEFLAVKLVIYDVMPTALFWDCDNKWVWIKWFSDTLTAYKKWEDDNVKIVRSSGTIEFVPIEDVKDKKFEFKIIKIRKK